MARVKLGAWGGPRDSLIPLLSQEKTRARIHSAYLNDRPEKMTPPTLILPKTGHGRDQEEPGSPSPCDRLFPELPERRPGHKATLFGAASYRAVDGGLAESNERRMLKMKGSRATVKSRTPFRSIVPLVSTGRTGT